jgi:hypothetical protein
LITALAAAALFAGPPPSVVHPIVVRFRVRMDLLAGKLRRLATRGAATPEEQQERLDAFVPVPVADHPVVVADTWLSRGHLRHWATSRRHVGRRRDARRAAGVRRRAPGQMAPADAVPSPVGIARLRR